MKQCKKCGIQVDTKENFCPLCYGNLSEETGEQNSSFFAEAKAETVTSKKRKKTIKILLFLNIFALSAIIFINIKTQTEPWSLIVALSCLYVWLTIEHTIISHDTPFRKVLLQVALITILLLTINKIYSTDHWLTFYAYPSVALLALLFMGVYVLFDKRRKTKIFSFFSNSILLLLVSVILLIFGIDTFKTLNQINIIAQALICFAYILFCGKTIMAEASKKLHI